MWWVKPHRDQSRGGFQNRDVGKIEFERDFGPDFGVDYARFADPPDPAEDAKLANAVKELTKNLFHCDLEVMTRNGFVILKGHVPDEGIRQKLITAVSGLPKVRDVITQLSVPH